MKAPSKIEMLIDLIKLGKKEHYKVTKTLIRKGKEIDFSNDDYLMNV